MRKRLGRFLPIVMLAILVQLFAPIAVVRASAAAIADPLTGAMICESMSVSQSGDHDSGNPHKLGICCPLCTLAHAVTPFGHPPTTHIAIQRAYQRVVWLESQSAPAVAVFGSSHQARAPPFHS
jgi:Protein of unknown function (DUF2946)